MRHNFVFPADLTPDEDGRLVVSFPDLPEALTDGANLAEALEMAADCLAEAVAGRIDDGEEIPEPSRPGPGQHLVAVPASMAAKAALYVAMREAGLTKAALARRLKCDEKEVRRMLDPRHQSRLKRLSQALAALNRRLVVGLSEVEPRPQA